VSDWSDEETDEPLLADHRNFYKVEKWSRDGQRVARLLFAGNSLDRARAIFQAEIRRRPRDRYTHPATRAGARKVATRLIG
jgi:hypothetical protein